MPRLVLALIMAVATAGCGQRPPERVIDVSVVGPALRRLPVPDSADRDALDPPSAVLLAATAQGLVRFDASGQIAPGLAERWSIAGDGRSLLFRLADDARPADAEAIVRRLRRAVAPGSRNRLRPLLGAIASIEAVTPQVIDIELSAPRPTILPLFAQPELAVAGASARGPFTLVRLDDGVAMLRPAAVHADDPGHRMPSTPSIRLRGERAAIAVARFAAGRAALVTGGTVADLALARAAAVPAAELRLDPVRGLFGLAFAADARGIARTAAGRRALSMAIDRDRIARALDVPGWAPATAILSTSTPEIAEPARLDWADRSLAERRTAAADLASPWRTAAGPPLRVAIADGPGARLVFRLVAADWHAIGIAAEAVAPGETADLTLIDEVAPADTAAFFLRRFACERHVPCSAESDAVLVAARHAPTLAERARLLAEADALIEITTPFIPLGPPIRWSLVSPSLDSYADSLWGSHPLDGLRNVPPR